MTNNKTYDFITYSEIMSMVRADLRIYDEMGLINDLNYIEPIRVCNEKLGLTFSESKELILEVSDFKAMLPPDFYKVFYMAALSKRGFSVANMINAFDNHQDQRTSYEADLCKGTFGCAENVTVIYKREAAEITNIYYNWDEIAVAKRRAGKCHKLSPLKNDGKYVVDFTDTEILTPFREGEIYMIYLSEMVNEEGEILVPNHPLILPWYKWTVIEKVLSDIIFNSDDANVAEKYKLASRKKDEAWLDAWNFTTDRTYQQMMADKKARELKWYNQYYKLLK
jgi:hypothetical protein